MFTHDGNERITHVVSILVPFAMFMRLKLVKLQTREAKPGTHLRHRSNTSPSRMRSEGNACTNLPHLSRGALGVRLTLLRVPLTTCFLTAFSSSSQSFGHVSTASLRQPSGPSTCAFHVTCFCLTGMALPLALLNPNIEPQRCDQMAGTLRQFNASHGLPLQWQAFFRFLYYFFDRTLSLNEHVVCFVIGLSLIHI